MVLSPYREPRPPIHPQAGLAVSRRGAGPWAADCHQLDTCRWIERPVPPLLHDGRGRRQEGQEIAARLVYEVVKPLVANQTRLTLAIDDTPTQRYGPFVQGAGIHHNPTPGPAGSPHVYGHVWVVLGCLAVHPRWGTYRAAALGPAVRTSEGPARASPQHRPEFRTKLETGSRVAAMGPLPGSSILGKPLWVVVDGAYAKAAVPQAGDGAGVTVVSRLRKDAALWTVPGPRRQGDAGGRGSTGRIASSWPSGPVSVAAGRPRSSSSTASRRRSGTRRSWRRGGRPAGVIRVVLVRRAGGMGCLLLHRPGCDRGRDPRDGRRSVRAGDQPFAIAKRSSGPASSRCGSCGQTSVHSTSASGRSR